MPGAPATDSAGPLPSERDFDPYFGDLDAQCAWKNFGGLTVELATKKFRESPDYYQEDFMFMGGKAFAYYFPVIETHLREFSPTEVGEDDGEAWILAKCIESQFGWKTKNHVLPLAERVLALSKYVRMNLGLFAVDGSDEQLRIDAAWSELEKVVNASSQSTT